MNPPFGLTTIQFVAIVIGVVALAFMAFFGGRVWMLRRKDARRVARVTSGAADYLRNVLVPDGNGGDYHLDFVLLTSRGVVIIDLRDLPGNVFGGDQMTDWTLMDGPRRSTFQNPQSGLYDRIASVKAVAQDMPGGRAHRVHQARQVSQGPAALHRDAGFRGRGIPQARRRRAGDCGVQYRPGWARLKETCKPSPHFRSSPVAVA